MKKSTLLVQVILLLLSTTACSGWGIQPVPFNPPTPFLPPTQTPSIFTPTPVVIGASATSTPRIATSTSITFVAPTTPPTSTSFPTAIPSNTPSAVPTQTSIPAGPAVSVEILGCNTSIDVTHGLGEVTNAFVVVRNTALIEVTNLKVTLNALDEAGVHPDKTVEIPSLQAGSKVTLKLTVDSTYRQETPIQIEVTGDGGLFERVGSASCKDIGILAPNPSGLNTPVPDNP